MKPETDKIIEILKALYPDAVCSLDSGGDGWRLLIQARLSAQCTDERVNIVSLPLFARYPTADDMARADITELEKIVRPCGLFHVKAKDIRGISAAVAANGLPDSTEGLLALPGVGRKIANLIMGDVFASPAIVADTHCIRICGKIGYYPEDEKNPLKVERILDREIPKKEQSDFCHRIVLFGREVCRARNPMCGECPISQYCAHYLSNLKER